MRLFLLFGSDISLRGYPFFSRGYDTNSWPQMMSRVRGIFTQFLSIFVVGLLRLLGIYFIIALELGRFGSIFYVLLVCAMLLFCSPVLYFLIGSDMPFLGAIFEFFSLFHFVVSLEGLSCIEVWLNGIFCWYHYLWGAVGS